MVSDIPMSYTDGGGNTHENLFVKEYDSSPECTDGIMTQKDSASPNGVSIIGGKCAVTKGMIIMTGSNNEIFLKAFDLIVKNVK